MVNSSQSSASKSPSPYVPPLPALGHMDSEDRAIYKDGFRLSHLGAGCIRSYKHLGYSQTQIADYLEVDIRTIQRRWQSVTLRPSQCRVKLSCKQKGPPPVQPTPSPTPTVLEMVTPKVKKVIKSAQQEHNKGERRRMPTVTEIHKTLTEEKNVDVSRATVARACDVVAPARQKAKATCMLRAERVYAQCVKDNTGDTVDLRKGEGARKRSRSTS